jgi:hypothetical protein
MIGFKDFVTPIRLGFTYARSARDEGLAVDRANEWIEQENVKVMSVETIVGHGIRVWYQVDGGSPSTAGHD